MTNSDAADVLLLQSHRLSKKTNACSVSDCIGAMACVSGAV